MRSYLTLYKNNTTYKKQGVLKGKLKYSTYFFFLEKFPTLNQ